MQIEFTLKTDTNTISEVRDIPDWNTLTNDQRSQLVSNWGQWRAPAENGWVAGAKPVTPPKPQPRSLILMCVDCFELFTVTPNKGRRPMTCDACVMPHFRRRTRAYAKWHYQQKKAARLGEQTAKTAELDTH